MAVAINVFIIRRDGVPPASTAFKLVMGNIDAGINDIDVNALTALRVVLVLGERGESESGTMTDTGQSLIGWVSRKE